MGSGPKFSIRKQSIAVFADRGRGGEKVHTGFPLKPDFDVPNYHELSRFDEDLSFSGDISARENLKFNCSRFDHGGWVIDEGRLNDLSELIELEHNLDDKLEIDDTKSFFNNLRIIRANRERDGCSSSTASKHNLPESSSSVQEEVFAQGNHWNSTIEPAPQKQGSEHDYPYISKYNSQHTLLNNKEFQKEIERFTEDSKNREKQLKNEIQELKAEAERKEYLREKRADHHKKLKARVKEICRFVNNDSEVNERSSTVEMNMTESTAKTIDWSKSVPIPVRRIKIERIRDLVHDAIFLLSESDSEDEEFVK